MGDVHLMAHQLINNKLESWSREYTGPKFHAVLCDPPYGLKFMGKHWDVVSAKEWGEALLPHLYPGALCLMFGGTRTWHKLATGMEEAGFEIWDTLMWLYGQGFPKGQDISKLIDKKNGDSREVIGTSNRVIGPAQKVGYLGSSTFRESENNPGNLLTSPGSELSAPWSGHKTCALKPAWEPILAFRVPAKTTYADLALEYGSGALNIDGARIEYKAGRDEARVSFERPVQSGRYPANLLLDDESATLLDEQSGVLTSGNGKCKPNGYTSNDRCFGDYGVSDYSRQSDSGGASRFFYCAKVSTSERNAGCEELQEQAITRYGEQGQGPEPQQTPRKLVAQSNHHPTVKPLALTEYLAKLLLPPSSVGTRRLLVPFAGSGSEMIGALRAGWDEVVGIEQDTEQGYCRIAEARIAHHLGAA